MKQIQIVVDVSGSMLEDGKSSVVKYLLFAAERLCGQFGLEPQLWQWGQEVAPLESAEQLVFSGRADERALLGFLEGRGAAAVLSDGAFSSRALQQMKELEHVHILAVGGDCGLPQLRKYAGAGKVFPAADLTACLQAVRDCGGC